MEGIYTYGKLYLKLNQLLPNNCTITKKEGKEPTPHEELLHEIILEIGILQVSRESTDTAGQ